MKEWTLTINQYGQSSMDHIVEIIPNEGKMKYMTPTLGGQSGSPVYSNSGVVAVHVGSGKKTG